jgi:hypothetical protein
MALDLSQLFVNFSTNPVLLADIATDKRLYKRHSHHLPTNRNSVVPAKANLRANLAQIS